METLLKEYGFPGVKKPRGMGLARPPRPSLPSPSACFEIILIFFAGICRWICNSQVPDFLQTGRARSDLEQKAGFEASPLRAATLGEPTGICPAVEAQIVGEIWVRHHQYNTTHLLPRAA